MTGIYLYADWDEFDREFDRLEKMPDPETVARLDLGLGLLFAVSQSDVHIDTTSLRRSGKQDSSVDESKHRWEGTITYGGLSTGVNNPVDYAWYEQRRDESHDFMRGVLDSSDMVIGDAVEKGIA